MTATIGVGFMLLAGLFFALGVNSFVGYLFGLLMDEEIDEEAKEQYHETVRFTAACAFTSLVSFGCAIIIALG